ncbi:MAG TPA: hypothetical protein VF223_21665 [Trebonia sp.]
MLSGAQALICNLERPDAVWIGYRLAGVDALAASLGVPRGRQAAGGGRTGERKRHGREIWVTRTSRGGDLIALFARER